MIPDPTETGFDYVEAMRAIVAQLPKSEAVVSIQFATTPEFVPRFLAVPARFRLGTVRATVETMAICNDFDFARHSYELLARHDETWELWRVGRNGCRVEERVTS